jgi:hypothetical protein
MSLQNCSYFLRCLLRKSSVFGDGREVQVVVAEDRALSSLSAEDLVGKIVLGAAGSRSFLDFTGGLGEGAGGDDGQARGKDRDEAHVDSLKTGLIEGNVELLL